VRFTELAQKLYRTSPAEWALGLRSRLQKFFPLREKPAETPFARILDTFYFARRDPMIQQLVERIRAGEDLYAVLQGFNAKNTDERVLEYPYFVDWFLKQANKTSVLDVGCVLNNKIVSSILSEYCNYVWFCNVAMEKNVFVNNPVYYHIAGLAKSFPGGESFPLITCLSTIEHIGFDNSQYGCLTPAQYTTPTLEPFIESFKKLAQLMSPGGNLLISVPFGYKEALVHPATGKIASQVFDYGSLKEGEAVLYSEGVACEVEVLAAQKNGWEQVDAATCNLRYADGCPAAAAIAMIKCKKKA